MLVLWRQMTDTDDRTAQVDDADALDELLDRLHGQATATQYPHSILIYAGNRYPQEAHGKDDRWIPADPGDGPQPTLFLVVGADESPAYWNTPGQDEHSSAGPHPVTQPEPEYFFEYFHGGQETYATQSSLIPQKQAHEAARQFVASGGQRPGNITWRTG
jgi:hypothetical protein